MVRTLTHAVGGLLLLTLESQICSHPCQPFCSAVAPGPPTRWFFLVLLPLSPPTTPSRFCIGLRAGEVLWAAVPGSQQSPGWQQGNSATQGSPMSLGCWSDPCGKVWMELAGDRRPGPGKVGELCSLSGWRGEIRTASWQRWAWPACLT